MNKRIRRSHLAPRERTLLAQRVRASYIFERTNWEAARSPQIVEPYKPSRKWDGYSSGKNIWSSVADWLHERDVSTHPLIRNVFLRPEFIERAPLPPELMSEDRLQDYLDSAVAYARNLRNAIGTIDEKLGGAAFIEEESIREFSPELINDRLPESCMAFALLMTTELPAAIRWSRAKIENMPAVISELQNDAAMDFSWHLDSYDAAFPQSPK